MSEMVERVARALFKEEYDAGNLSDAARMVEWERSKEYWLASARAAIEAMREPTDAMAIEGCHAGHPDIGASWRAMINVALKERP